MATSVCSAADCGRVVHARGLCSKHYLRLRRNGHLYVPQVLPWGERFWSKIESQPSGCWEWQGALHPSGYAMYATRQRPFRGEYVHRLVYMMTKGDIPPGYQIDHLCFNRACCNPNHLEAVTPSVNYRRMWARKKALKREGG